MKMRSAVTVLAALCALEAPAHAATLQERVRAALKSGVPRSQVSLVVNDAKALGVPDAGTGDMLGVMIRARRDDVPVKVISGKIVEGLSKHVRADRIVDAADRLEHAWKQSETLYRQMAGHFLKEVPGSGEFEEAMAIAIFNGMDPDGLLSLYRTAPDMRESYYIEGTMALTSLISSGRSKEQSMSFMKKEFSEHRSIEEIQKRTTEIMEHPHDDTMEHEMGKGHGDTEMNMPEQPGMEQEHIQGGPGMDVHGGRD
ncbi:MAG: hypothetical protein M1491_02790 [Deltaproteobacteria bacterium]|nr:hypothetical protein [Deltaproteobacteria bacterium]MCL5276569.1 hypothetical protein [Deltaproteobacteria bacterium]